MRLADTGRAHQHQSFFAVARELADKLLGQELCRFERRRVLRILAHVRAVTFKVAVFVPLRNSCALDYAGRAFLHAAVAGRTHRPRAVGASDHLPSRAAAELAVLESHRNKAYGRARRTASRPGCELL